MARTRPISIVPSFFTFLLVLALLLYCMLGAFAVFGVREAESFSAQASINAMNVCVENIRHCFRSADTELNTLLYNYALIDRLSDDDASERYFATIKIKNLMEERVYLNRYIDVLLVANTRYPLHICRAQNTTYLTQTDAFIACAEQAIADAPAATRQWQCVFVGEQPFFMSYFKILEASYVYGFIRADELFAPIAEIEQTSVVDYALTDADGNVLDSYRAAVPEGLSLLENTGLRLFSSYYVVTTDFENMRMCCILRTRDVLQKNRILMWFILAFFLISAGFLLYIVAFFRREIIRPMKQLSEQAERIRGGDLDYRVQVSCRNHEFAQVQKSYLTIMDELVELRTSAYQRQLAFRDIEQKYIRMQLKPHFFLNILSTIHTMSRNGSNEEICQFIESLYDVIRYLFKTGLYTVPLHDEVQHLQHYIHMQSLLYKDSLIAYYDIDPALNDWPIPQLILHTFIENIYKHTVSHGHVVLLDLRAERDELDGAPCLHVTVQDTGVGFSEGALEALNAAVPGDETGVGLRNIREMLKLLYDRDDLLRFGNVYPHGACIDLRIPPRPVAESTVGREAQSHEAAAG